MKEKDKIKSKFKKVKNNSNLLLSIANSLIDFKKRKFLFRNVKTRFFELCNISVNAL